MILIVDTEKLTVTKQEAPEEPKDPVTIADLMKEHRGVKEYEGIVKDIQTWYYGSLVKASWCASAISYFAEKAGVLAQMGGKADNVYDMWMQCLSKSPLQCYGLGTVQRPDFEIRKGDVLFWLWKGGTMTATSSKHVGTSEMTQTGNTLFCLGGNQKDKICTLEYDRTYLWGVFRPRYQ